MERNVRHVQRWLERCLEAYRHRRHGAALAELESARAELEIAREKLAEELAGQGRVRECRLERFCRIGFTSIVILFALALPTAHLSDHGNSAPFLFSLQPEGTSLEVVTEEERELLENLRRTPVVAEVPSMESHTAVRMEAQLPLTARAAVDGEVEPSPPVKDQIHQPRKNLPTQATLPKPTQPDSDTLKGIDPVPSVEEVLSLLQAGQRALQHPGKGIPIQP